MGNYYTTAVLITFGIIPVVGIIVTQAQNIFQWTVLSHAAEKSFMKNAADRYIAKKKLQKLYANYRSYADVRVFYPFGIRLAWRLPNPVFRHFLLTKNPIFGFTNRYYGIGDVWFTNGRINVFGYVLQFTPGRLEDMLYYVMNNNALLAMFFADNSANVAKAWRRGLIWYASNSVVFVVYCLSYELQYLPQTKKFSFLYSAGLNLLFLPLRTIFDTVVSVLLGFYLPIPVDDPLASSKKSLLSWCSKFCKALCLFTHITKDLIAVATVTVFSTTLYYVASRILFNTDTNAPKSAGAIGGILFNYFFSMLANVMIFLIIYEVFVLPRYFKKYKVWDPTEYFTSDDEALEMPDIIDTKQDIVKDVASSEKSQAITAENPLHGSDQAPVSVSTDTVDKIV
eukprot:gene24640-29773_t